MNRSMKRTGLLALAAGVVLLGAIAAHAQVPQLMNYQGVLKDGTGTPIDGTVSILFSIYDVPTGGTALWSETQGSVTVTGGLFNVLLGSVTPLPAGLFYTYGTYPPASNPDRYLGVTVGSDPEMTPRQRLVSVSDALKAGDADTLGNGLVVADKPGQTVVVGPVGPGAEVTLNSEISPPVGDQSIANFHTYGAFSRLVFRSAQGTLAAPSAVLGGTAIGNLQFRGYDGTGYGPPGGAGLTAKAEETFTPSAHGTRLLLYTTPVGSTTAIGYVFFTPNQRVGIGVLDPEEKLHVNGNVKADSYLSNSSRALKKEITPLAEDDYQEILHQINGIQMVRYLYKTESNRPPHLGVIAEESPQQILDPAGKAVSLYDYASFLLAGLKAQAEQIKAQSEQIKSLTEKIEALEAQQAH